MGLGLLALAACVTTPLEPTARPVARPAVVAPAPAPTFSAPSERSVALARHYSRLQANLMAQGLLRTGGGSFDTPYTATDLARNFERIAFYDEYARGGGLRASNSGPDVLRKWVDPIRMAVEFGASVTPAMRATDKKAIDAYVARLSRVTGHPISVNATKANFHVIISSEDDRAQTLARVRHLAPNIGSATTALVRNPPRSIYCMVLTFVGGEGDNTYDQAIALIRSEQPDLMRRSCIHEELAQGLGLGNDSALARPSIFNDDEEFALLTTHDEELLRLLFNPALRPGVTLDEARPLIRRILAARGAGSS